MLWNKIWGDGLETSVLGAWQNWLDYVDLGNRTVLENTRSIMMDLINLNRELASTQQQIGIRAHFESQGRTVDWNDATKQFSIDGQWFDSSPYENLDGRLQATYEQLQRLDEKLGKIPRYASGGYIDKDQLAILHKDELVLNPQDTKRYLNNQQNIIVKPLNSADLDKLIANYLSANGLPNVMASALSNLSGSVMGDSIFGGESSIEQNLIFNGVTSESFMRDLPVTIRGVATDMINQNNNAMNRAAKARGIRGFSG